MDYPCTLGHLVLDRALFHVVEIKVVPAISLTHLQQLSGCVHGSLVELVSDGPSAPCHRMSGLRLALLPYQLVVIYKILFIGWRWESTDGPSPIAWASGRR